MKGKCFDSTGRKIPYFEYVQFAEFPGGNNKLKEYLKNAIVYPLESRRNNEEGKVNVRFIVDKEGGIASVEVVKGVSKALDKEAIRVVTQMPKWTPAYSINGHAMHTYYSLTISFQLKE